MSEVVQKMAQKTRLGDLLVQRKVITQQQLDQALNEQKQRAEYLGEILIRLGFVEERDIVAALVVQCNLPYIAIANYSIDKKVLHSISSQTARKYHAIPLDKVGNVLSVVMADPMNDEIKNELAKEARCDVTAFIATKTEIMNAINTWYTS